MKKYSYEFKTRAVEKALGRDPDVSVRLLRFFSSTFCF